MLVKEDDFRNAQWDCVETRIFEAREVDIFRAPEFDGVTIHVTLSEDRFKEMALTGLDVLNDFGEAIDLLGDEVNTLTGEDVEVVAWELIEDMAIADGYMNGRTPIEVDGARAPVGAIIQRISEPEPDLPDLA